MSQPGQDQKTAYQSLKERFAEVANVQNAIEILNKDAETVMPPGSEKDRTQQVVTLSTIAHRLLTEPVVEQWLDQAEAGKASLSRDDQRNLALMRKSWVHSNALSDDLAKEEARIGSEGERLHTKLRGKAQWGEVQDWLAHTFEIARQVAQAKMPKLGTTSLYGALLDSFSPETTTDTVERELGRIARALPQLVQEAVKRQAAEPAPIPLQGPFPKEQQAELYRRVVKAMGFDFNRGRFDVLDVHPSCGGTSDDIRFTADYDEDNFLTGLYSAIHENGHALYDQNTPAEWRYQPAGTNLGMAIHESQSRIMELHACGTPEFFRFLEKEAREVFNRPNDPALAADNLRRLKQQVQPSLIRIEADELTYPAHIVLRHKLESGLVNGTLKIDDLPQAWNNGLKDLLGVTPPNDAKGCLQDVHWFCGLIGYFPAYTLGDMGAAQLFDAACRDKPEIRGEIGKGNFTPLREWLRDNVHSKGSLLTPDELFVQATGEKLNAQYYLDHLSRRYTGKPWQPVPQAGSNQQGHTPAP